MRLPRVKLLKRLESRPTPFANVKATNFALVAADRDTERAEALMIGEARNLMEQHWRDIEALAKRLLIKGRINFLHQGRGI